MKLAAAALVIAAIVCVDAQEQRPVFRSRRDLVFVSVAVKDGNAPVGNLTAADFRLYDNDVLQEVDALSIESVPIDVSLFLDTSGSTSAVLGDMARGSERIFRLLLPGDRLRIFTIGLSVYNPVGWQSAGAQWKMNAASVGGISLVYDATLAAISHQPAAGHRHLVVALTDGIDCGSVVSPEALRDAATRSEAVLHWVEMGGYGGGSVGAGAWCDASQRVDLALLRKVVEATGGAVTGGNPEKAFAKIYEDFRRSYVLTFSPTGVKPGGWHRLRVEVPKGKYKIHARPGYFGS